MKRLYAVILILLGIVTMPCDAFSQNTPKVTCTAFSTCAIYETQLNALLREAAPGRAFGQNAEDALEALAALDRVEELFSLALARQAALNGQAGFDTQAAFNSYVQAWQQARVDKQMGTTASSGGTTNLVSKPSTPDLLGLAMHLGALTETVNGTTATLQANLDGAFRGLVGAPISCLVCEGTPILRGINLTATFDLSRQGTQSVAPSGSATANTPTPSTILLPKSTRQLSTFTARYNAYNPLDVRSKEFKNGWDMALKKRGQELLTAAQNVLATFKPVFDTLSMDGAYITKEQEYADKFKLDAVAGNADKLVQDFTDYVQQVATIVRTKSPDLDTKVFAAVQAYTRFSQLNYEVVEAAKGKPQVTIEYTFNRPVSQPDTHDVRFILGLHPFNGTGLVSINAAGTFYGGMIAPGSTYGRVRDFQFSGEFDRAIGDPINHPATFSLAGYLQYQFDPSVINIGAGNLAPGTNITLPKDAKALLGTKGTLGVVQAKITINAKSGINIPVAVSWANKTDLLNANDVRGQIGISYDFSSLSQVLTGH